MKNPDTTTLDAKEWCVQRLITAIWASPFSEVHAREAVLGKLLGFRVIFPNIYFAREKSKTWLSLCLQIMKIVLISKTLGEQNREKDNYGG